ncbi:IS3 family transposase [Caenispirillum salinarum]|uniref:IS3 family transposase n=1 Tax=Caenispirillum salinarum TaxID=859058 RepID=UPI00384FB02A
MSKNRRNHSASFKAKVAMEALSGEKTVAELSAKYDVHPTMINAWKRTLRDQAATAFEKGPSKADKDKEALVDELYKQIGQLKVENDFLAVRLKALKRVERRAMIDISHPTLSLTRQCRLVGISRSSLYYRPVNDDTPKNTEDRMLMAAIDRHFLDMPYLGSRRMAALLRREGWSVGRKRVRRLMRLMGVQAVYRRPRTTVPHPEHRVYPYLLRTLVIDRPNQVWAADITYIPMRRGFLYLVAIMDWHSRKVLSWRLSNTMDADFCVAALEQALETYGPPEIFNSDQGSQFTSLAFTGTLKAAGVRISMDGKGRCMDNIFIERLWRSLKYEEVYLKAYTTGSEAKAGIGAWVQTYNERRPHQALAYATPDEVYWRGLPGSGLRSRSALRPAGLAA